VILVTTAGKVGSEAVRLLRERDVPVRVLVRDPAKVTALADVGAEVAEGDLDVPASIDDAMAGVSAVVLVSPAVPAQELPPGTAAAAGARRPGHRTPGPGVGGRAGGLEPQPHNVTPGARPDCSLRRLLGTASSVQLPRMPNMECSSSPAPSSAGAT
jgi:uncharacterized protein YbjT (DUF2867 family)